MTDIEKQLKDFEPLIHKIIHKHMFVKSGSLEYEELFSTGIIAALKAIPKFDDTRNTRIETFIYKVIKNKLITTMKSQKNKPVHISINDEKSYETDCNNLVYNNNGEILLPVILSSIARLKIKQRNAIEYYLSGYTYKEISNMENISVGAVKSRRHRGIKQLKKLLT